MSLSHSSLGVETIDDLAVVLGDLVDAVVGDAVRIFPSGSDGVRVAGPAWRDRLIARLGEQFLPGLPRRRVQPQAMDEDDRRFGVSHDIASFGGWPMMPIVVRT